MTQETSERPIDPAKDAGFTRLGFFLLSLAATAGTISVSVYGIVTRYFTLPGLAAVFSALYLTMLVNTSWKYRANRNYSESSILLLTGTLAWWALIWREAFALRGGLVSYFLILALFFGVNFITVKYLETAMVNRTPGKPNVAA